MAKWRARLKECGGASRVCSLGPQKQGPEVTFYLVAHNEQVDGQKDHSAEKRDETERETGKRKVVPPGCPKSGQREKAHEIEIELPGPVHGAQVAEEHGKQVPSVICYHEGGVT